MRTLINFLFFVGNLIFILFIFAQLERLNFMEWITLSITVSYFHTKNILDKTDLENKIFELKELIKKKQL